MAGVVFPGLLNEKPAWSSTAEVATLKNEDLARVLLDAGARVDARQTGWRTPLMLASISGSLPVVRLLLDAGADVNAKDSNERTALDLALENRRQDVPEVLRSAAARTAD